MMRNELQEAGRQERSGVLPRGLGLLSLLLGLGACTSGLGGVAVEQDDSVGLSSAETGLGVDFGFSLAEDQAPSEIAITAASIPSGVEGETRELAFIAFVTESPAAGDDDVDALVRDASPPTDSNGAKDVFLMIVEDDLVDTGATGRQPVAFNRALVNTFRHDRCQNCHAVSQSTTPDGEPFVFPGTHPGGPPPITNSGCTDCHNSELVPDLAGVQWFAPDGAEFELRGRTDEELSERAHAAGFDVEEHLLVDTRVRWAIESGRVPQIGDGATGLAGTSSMWDGTGRDQGPVPLSYDTFVAQIEAWRDGGFQATAQGSVRDIVLVSGRQAADETGDGESLAPSITWVPNNSFDPRGGATTLAGHIRVAFASDATDLTGDTSANRDIFVTSIAVHMDSDPSTGAAAVGSIDLRADFSTTNLISEGTSAGSGGDADSDAPSIDSSGTRVAFQSQASNLVADFGSGAGGTDVFLNDAGTTMLISGSRGSANQGGDGNSMSPFLSPIGGVVAFVSTADDLIDDDTNGDQDIFHARWTGAELEALQRDSVATDGSEATGGDCRSPSVFFDSDTSEVSVVFESDKTSLTAEETGAVTQVFLREGDATFLVSQLESGTASEVGNGASSAPFMSPTGKTVIYQSLADNLDAVHRVDDNEASDVFLIDLVSLRDTGRVESRRLSVDSNFESSNGTSDRPLIAAPIDADGVFGDASLTLFQTDAGDLGRSSSTDIVCVFLEFEGVTGGTDFTADPVQGDYPLEVSFESTATGDIVEQNWNFGDSGSSSNTATGTEAVHTYESAGMFTVTLTVTRNDSINGGMVDEVLEKADLITVEVPPIVAEFSGTPLTGDFPLAVTFTNDSTGVPDGSLFEWDFGDGGTDTDPVEVIHTYTEAGSFDVSLSLSAPGEDLIVRTRDDYVVAIQPIDAALSAEPNPAPAGADITFTNETLGDRSEITAYEWYSVDEDVVFSTAENPSTRSFATPGDYDIRLTLTYPGGPDSAAETVRVLNADDAFFTYSPVTGIAGQSISFDGSPEGGGLTYAWDFDGFGSSADENPSFTFTDPSSGSGYQVELTVTGGAGAPSITRDVVVVAPTSAAFSFATDDSDVTGHTVDFTAASTTGTNLSFAWNFGDGNFGTGLTPSHTYDTKGTYLVQLNVTGDSGADSANQNVTVDPISYEGLIHPILNAATACHDCHNVAVAFNWGVTTDATTLHGLLFNVMAAGGCCNPSGILRVDATNGSAVSLLVQVLDPAMDACNSTNQCGVTNGADMNNGFANISEANVDLVREWIDDGAEF